MPTNPQPASGSAPRAPRISPPRISAGRALSLPRGVRLRLNVALPLSVALFTVAGGAVVLNVLRERVPAVNQAPSAMLLAVGLMVGVALISAVAGAMLAAGIRAPLKHLLATARRSGLPTPWVGGATDELKLLGQTVRELSLLLGELELSERVLFELNEPVLLLAADGSVAAMNERAAGFFNVTADLAVGRPLKDLLGGARHADAVTHFVERGLSWWRARRAAPEEKGGEAEGGLVLTEVVEWPLENGTSHAVELRLVVGNGGLQQPWGRKTPGAVAALLLLPRGGWGDLRLRMERLNDLASLGALTAELSHELKGPLAALAARAELALGDLPEGSPKRQRLAEVIREVEETSQFMERVLDVAQPRRLDWALVDCGGVARRAIEVCRELAEQAGHRLDCSVEGEVPPVEADQERLLQLLTNLVRNGCDAVEPGGRVSLTVRGRTDDPDMGEVLSIAVHNTGGPIPREVHQQMFRPFYTTKPGGTGLGLPICQYLVRALGGVIRVTSEAGLGTTFEVVLPAARA